MAYFDFKSFYNCGPLPNLVEYPWLRRSLTYDTEPWTWRERLRLDASSNNRATGRKERLCSDQNKTSYQYTTDSNGQKRAKNVKEVSYSLAATACIFNIMFHLNKEKGLFIHNSFCKNT